MNRPLSLALLATTALFPSPLLAQSATAPVLPTGGQVAAGSATIGAAQGGAMQITQGSDRAVINWQGFSIGQGGRVDISQPSATAALLNRVTGTATSEIAGQLNANGRVFLINPNGILITGTGSVNAAGFIASTRDIADKDFMAGSDELTVTAPRGRVAIGRARGGYAGLVGGLTNDRGLVRAGLTEVTGGDGTKRAALDLTGDGFMQVAVPSGGISVAGTITAHEVVLSAGTAREAARGTVNLSGTIRATGIGTSGGTVVLTGDTINLAGARIDASGTTGGGTVTIGGGRQGTGPLPHATNLIVDAATTIRADASGTGNGGQVTLWSDGNTNFAGTISARGAGGGAGGDAEVSGHQLAYTGTADLTGTRFGTLLLDPYNVTVSTAADSNQSGFTATGNDSVINTATLQNALATANVTVSTGTGGNQAGNITLATGSPLSWATGATLTLQAAGAVTLNSAVSAVAGGLTVNAGAGTSTATAAVSVARFTLGSGSWVQNSAALPAFAAGDFELNGGSFLRAAGGAGTAASPYQLTDIYGVQGMGSSAALRAASYVLANDIDAGGTAAWNGGAGFSPVGDNQSQFTGSLSGAGHTITGLFIARPGQSFVGLIGFLGSGGAVSGLGLVGGSVSGAAYVGGLVGDNHGTVTQSYATGSISAYSDVGGLVGDNFGTVSQSYATGTVSGTSYVGGLAGYNVRTVSQSYATGGVSGRNAVGGLLGLNSNSGTISSSFWDTQSTGQANGVGGGSSSGATGLTSAQARTGSSYVGFDFTGAWYQAGDLRPILRSEAAAAVNGVTPVSNLDQLQLMGANLTGSYVLTRDIDASATAGTATSAGIFGDGGFVPAGSFNSQFTGGLSGAGHTITGLTIARPSQYYVGLIGYLGAGGTVSGLGLVGGSVSGAAYVGDLVGEDDGTVTQSYATGSVSGRNVVGGLVGYNERGVVSQSYAAGSVSGTYIVGGLIGTNGGGSTVSQSYATGSISGGTFVGGLVGYNPGTISSSFWDTQSTGQANGIGSGSSSGTTGLTSAQARMSSSYTGFDFTNIWYQAGDLRPILRSEAAAAVNGVIPVSNLDQLQLIGANLSASYMLTRDIDASATAGTATGAGIFGVGGFVPLGGTYASANFTGTLSGAGHTITGLTIARPGQGFVGLIGDLAAGGRVSGLGLVGGSVSGLNNVGGLVGANNGTVSQSYDTGDVSGSAAVGGLVGYNPGTVTQSYATGRVSGDRYVGGLVGTNAGTVSQSYASGSASGFNYVGGLIGYDGGGSTVSQTYATGKVSGQGPVGGLVGYKGAAISSSYWDTQSTGQANGVGDGDSTGVTGRTTAQMQDLSAFRTNYAGFDFANVWSPPNQVGQNNGSRTAYYPQLYALSNVVAVTPAAATRTYGGANPTGTIASYTGVRAGDFVTALGSVTSSATVTSDVGSYATSDSGAAVTSPVTGRSYRFVYVPGTLAVTPATLTVAGAMGVNRTYTGTTALPTGATGFTYTGVLNGDAVSVAAGSAAYDSANVGNRVVQVSGLTIGGAKAADYVLSATAVNGSGAISPATLVYTANTATRSYGAANPAFTGVVTGFVNGETQGSATTGTLAFSSPATGGSNVGAYAIYGSGLAANNGNYVFTQAAGNARALTISPALLAVTGSKTYDTATGFTKGQLSVVGGVNGETVTLTGGAGAAPSANVGSYANGQLSNLTINVTGGNAMASNYALPTTGTLAITPATITVAGAGGVNKTYDGTTALPGGASGFTASGVFASDASRVTVSAGSAMYDSANAGRRAINVSALTLSGAAAGNYVLSSTAVTGSGTISPATLTYTANAVTRSYGAANPAFSGVVTGFVNGETLGSATTGTLAFSSPATGGSNVGSYAINGSGLSANNGNYVFTQAAGNASALAISPALLTVGGERAYDATTNFTTGQLSVAGAQNGETVTLTSGTGTAPSANVGSYAGSPLSNLAINVSGGNALASNYQLPTTGTLAIGLRPVTVTADAQSRIYGNANPALTYTVGGSGLAGGDTLAGSLATIATPSSNVGGYAITQGSVTSANNPNYAISYIGNMLMVTPRPITVTADAQSRIYGNANPALTYAVGGSGLANGDTLAGALATVASAGSNVGIYAITQGSLTSGSNPNYAIGYTGANLTVTPRPLTVTAAVNSKTYDGTTGAAATPTVTSGSFYGNDGGAFSERYASAKAGTGLTLTPTGTISDGNGGANYAVTYVASALGTISPATLTYTANGATRTYGAANPAFTGVVTGFVNGETQGSATTGTLAFTSPTTSGSNVGSYAINGSGLSATNYTFVQAAGNATALTISPALLAVSGSKVYDTATGFTTGQLAVVGGVNGETVTLTGGTGTASSPNVGSYANGRLSNLIITVAGGNALSSNYALPTTGTLAISPATITVAGASGVNKTYDGTTALPGGATGFTASGVFASDASRVTVTSGGAMYDSANAGNRTINVAQLTLSGAAAGNYLLSSTAVTGSGTISPATLTYTANAATRSYGAANPTFTGTVTGFVNGETQGSATTGTLAFSSPATGGSNVGQYAINGSGLSANNGNYIFQQAAGNATALTITPALLTVGGERAYDGSTGFATGQLTVAGAQNGETVALTSGTGATTGANVGTYANSAFSNLAIAVSGGNGSAANYRLPATGTLVIDPRLLTVTADAQSRIYGNANPALTYTVGGMGLVGGETLAGALATPATAQSAVGSYAITQGTLAASGNYQLTYIGNTLSITPRALVVTPDAVTRIYGNANPATGTATADNLVNGDTVTGVALATPATTASGVGSYALAGSGATGTGLANYAVTYAVRANGLTITPRALAITANGQTRVYGDANPALTYSLGGQGLVNGDTLAGALATGATATSGVGSYAISQGSLAASANYQVTYTGATLAVTPRPLLITADNQSRFAGEPNPPLTFTLGGRGLVNGDALTGALATGATPSSPPGAYAIAQGSLAATPNYQVTYKPGVLTVGFAPTVPFGFLAGSQERDAFAIDTLPLPDQARLTINTTPSTTVLDESEASRPTDICPKEKPCKRPR